MYDEEDFLLLSGIQHFSFCRRQWALIHIENAWQENVLTAKGRIDHDRVHDKSVVEKRGDELTIRGLPIRSERLGVVGECDAVVFSKNDNGIHLHAHKGLWAVMPVEYKHGVSKANDCDRLQVSAQAMCLEEMFGCRIEQAALYYQKTRNREYITVSEELRECVEKMFLEMHSLYDKGYTPKVTPTGKCNSCSLQDLCLPKLLKEQKTAMGYIREHIEEN